MEGFRGGGIAPQVSKGGNRAIGPIAVIVSPIAA